VTALPEQHRALSQRRLIERLEAATRARFGGGPRGAWKPEAAVAADTGDLGAGLLDAFALALHVLWTYQEEWAKETFLGLARLDESSDRLLGHLAYQLGPGAAASGVQHFRCRAGTRASLPPGFALSSSAALEGEVDAHYETSQALTVHPELNELRGFPVALSASPRAPSAAPGSSARKLPRPTGGFGPPKSIAGDLIDRLDDARLGDEASRRAAVARQEARKLGDLLGVVGKHGGNAGACQALQAVCEALSQAKEAARAPISPADRMPGALSDSQEMVARQLKALGAQQGAVAAQLERVLTRFPGESDAAYAERLAAMAAFLDAFVSGLVQDARDQVALARGTDALLRLDRVFAGPAAAPRVGSLGRAAAGTDSLFLLTGASPATSRPLDMLRPGDWFVIGEDVDGVDDAGQRSRVRQYRQLVRVLRVTAEAPLGSTRALTRVTFAPPLARAYDLDRLVLLGNVAPISHGLSIEERGERSSEPGVFPLRERPLTWVRDPAAPSGRRPEVSLAVDGRPFRRVEDLLGAGPGEAVFALENTPGGGARVRVGAPGQVPPVGPGSEVVLRYRIGVGRGGDRPARRIDAMLRPHPAVEATFNPLPVAAGADPEPRSLARRRGPEVTSAMDRAASASDLRALALAFDGVSRARVFIEGTARRARAVVVAAGVGGAPLGDGLRDALHAHLAARVPPEVALAVESRRLVGVRARLLLRLAPGADPLAVVATVRARLGLDLIGDASTHPGADAAAEPGLLDPNRVDLDDDLALSQLYGALGGIDGLHAVVARALYRADGPVGLFDRLEAGPREMLAWASPAPHAPEPVELEHESVRDR
jgi:hypothetical protein